MISAEKAPAATASLGPTSTALFNRHPRRHFAQSRSCTSSSGASNEQPKYARSFKDGEAGALRDWGWKLCAAGVVTWGSFCRDIVSLSIHTVPWAHHRRATGTGRLLQPLGRDRAVGVVLMRPSTHHKNAKACNSVHIFYSLTEKPHFQTF